MKQTDPIRMCVACRQRVSQKKLIRLQLIGDTIVLYRGFGRSIYLCQACSLDRKKIKNTTKRLRVKYDELFMILKELNNNG